MNLTFLDASTLDRGDIDFTALEAFGSLVRHATTSPDEVTDRCAGQQIVITNKVVLDANLFANAPDLKLVLVAATGVNVVDLEAATRHGVPVCNVAGYSTASVAQHVTALLLDLATNTPRYAAEAKQWPASPIFTRLDHPSVELAGKTMGIVGLGEIGSAVAGICEALGMTVQVLAREGSSNQVRPELPRLPREEFLATSDVVSLHCPLTADNEGMINRETLALMKPTAFLLNASRGPLVDEEALADALRNGTIAGAGLDVLSVEPPPADHPLLQLDLPNLLITPHSAWGTRESRQRLVAGLVGNLRSFLDGASTNRVA